MKYKCVYGGGESCVRQGGNGFVSHPDDYLHPHPTAIEMLPILKSLDEETASFSKSLENFVDEEEADLYLGKSFDRVDLLKSFYHFDIDSLEGAQRLMELLPVLSDEIIKDVYGEIFPGYPVDDDESFNIRMARLELKGYLLDYLHLNEE